MNKERKEKMKKTLAVKFEIIEGRIQLFDADGNKVEGKNARWRGGFFCSNNQLTSLEGAPSEVGGDFWCDNNQLTSLEGAPRQSVTGLRSRINQRIKAALNLRGFSRADGILARIISKRGGVMKVRPIGKSQILYLVTDGNGNYSHGETLKQAKEDLIFKTVAQFDGKLPEKAKVREWIGIYRAATGACATGVKMFVQDGGFDLDKTMTANEVLKKVKGRYGCERFEELVRAS